jgi:hypothetical protein
VIGQKLKSAGNAAEALISNPIEMMEVHHKASTLIREEIVPRVRENLPGQARSVHRETSRRLRLQAAALVCRGPAAA